MALVRILDFTHCGDKLDIRNDNEKRYFFTLFLLNLGKYTAVSKIIVSEVTTILNSYIKR